MSGIAPKRYDVIIAGARCAGSATAMLLAKQGLSVLVVDPARRGSDTLSTHALMRSAVLQLHRWGLLDEIRASGAPAIRRTTFHYGNEVVPVDIREKDGVDALVAPRRMILDQVLAHAAQEAGAEVAYGHSVVGLRRNGSGRVVAAEIVDSTQTPTVINAGLVIGADGVRSRVARLVESPKSYEVPHRACSIYGYFQGLPQNGYHWYYKEGGAAGTIPTNDATCVFVSIPGVRFDGRRRDGLARLYGEALQLVSPGLARLVGETGGPDKLRAFPGVPGFLRNPTGPGWALVGDAAFFRDPLTAHGISDALREAELLSRAILEGSPDALANYGRSRDLRVRGLLDVTDRIASFDWSLDEVKEDHLALTREMKLLGDLIRKRSVGHDPTSLVGLTTKERANGSGRQSQSQPDPDSRARDHVRGADRRLQPAPF